MHDTKTSMPYRILNDSWVNTSSQRDKACCLERNELFFEKHLPSHAMLREQYVCASNVLLTSISFSIHSWILLNLRLFVSEPEKAAFLPVHCSGFFCLSRNFSHTNYCEIIFCCLYFLLTFFIIASSLIKNPRQMLESWRNLTVPIESCWTTFLFRSEFLGCQKKQPLMFL